MLKKPTLLLGALLALSLTLSGCASSRPLPVASQDLPVCPEFVPSPEALKPISGTGWKPLAQRVIETFRETSSQP